MLSGRPLFPGRDCTLVFSLVLDLALAHLELPQTTTSSRSFSASRARQRLTSTPPPARALRAAGADALFPQVLPHQLSPFARLPPCAPLPEAPLVRRPVPQRFARRVRLPRKDPHVRPDQAAHGRAVSRAPCVAFWAVRLEGPRQLTASACCPCSLPRPVPRPGRCVALLPFTLGGDGPDRTSLARRRARRASSRPGLFRL